MAENISFRQVGREMNGKRYKGPVVDAYNRLTHPSIPTHTLQILTATERKGAFGASSDRFNYRAALPLPGPADYSDSALNPNPSHSAKGYGGLISKESRFKRFQYSTAVPGPGTYNCKVSEVQSGPKFTEVSSRSLSHKLDFPAPGSYDPQNLHSTAVTSTFKSKSRKLRDYKNENPAPWQYDVPHMAAKPFKQLSAAFKLPVQARRNQVNLYDPHCEPTQQTVPGPGEYDTSGTTQENRASSMFRNNNIDRFGEPKRKKRTNLNTPGPGAYEYWISKEAEPTPGAAFLSESERVYPGIDHKPLGPAFYRPSPIPKKRSFHLNANKVWL